MKFTKIIMMVAASAMLFASCAKETPGGGEGEIKAGKMVIQFMNDDIGSSYAPGTKAVGDDFDNDDSRIIKNLNVFVLDGTNAILSSQCFYIADVTTYDVTTEHDVTTAAKKVVAIANTGDITSFKSLPNLTALKAKVGDLNDMSFSSAWMSETGTVVFDQTSADGTKDLAEVELTLKIIPARIDVSVVNAMKNQSTAGSLKIKDVSILYSGAYTYYIDNSASFMPTKAHVDASITSAKYFYSGKDWATSTIPHNIIAKLSSAWDASFDGASTPATATPYKTTFYAFPSHSADYNTAPVYARVSVRGEYNDPDDGSLKEKYFTVFFSPTEAVAKQTLANGKKYTVNISLEGDATQGSGGDPDPGEENNPAVMTVKVTPADWIAVTAINKKFE